MYSWVGCLEPTCLWSRKRKMVLPSFFASNSSLISMVNKWLFVDLKSQPTNCICPYCNSSVLMRIENLSTLEKENSSLISMINKWLFVYVKSQPTVCICPYYKSGVLMRMENLSILEKVKSVTLFYDQQVVVDLKSQPSAVLVYNIVF